MLESWNNFFCLEVFPVLSHRLFRFQTTTSDDGWETTQPLWNHSTALESSSGVTWGWSSSGSLAADWRKEVSPVNLEDECALVLDIFWVKEVACVVVNSWIILCFLKTSATFRVPSSEYLNAVMNSWRWRRCEISHLLRLHTMSPPPLTTQTH